MANTTNFGWETPDDTDLVKDGALAMRTLGNAIDTSLVDLKGGTTGQVLSKNTNTDMDFVWSTPNVGDITEVQAGTGISVASGTGPIPVVTNTVATAFDAKGDLIVGTGADTFTRLAVGSANQVLTVDSATTSGLKWAAAAGGNLTIAQIATGTLSGTSVTFSSLSTYDEIHIALSGINLSATGTPNLRINGNTGNNYTTYWTGQSGANTYGSTFTGSRVYLGGNDDWKSANTSNNSWLTLTNCKASGFTTIEFTTKYTNNAGNVAETASGKAIYVVSEAVSSIDLLVNGTITFNAGSYTIWGG